MWGIISISQRKATFSTQCQVLEQIIANRLMKFTTSQIEIKLLDGRVAESFMPQNVATK